MTSDGLPTVHQAEAIRYFDDGTAPTRPCRDSTQEVCRRRGWIERCDEWPYHRTTDAGREALAALDSRRGPNVAPAAAARRRIGDESRAQILREHGWTCTPPANA
jgi:hypothetical protein